VKEEEVMRLSRKAVVVLAAFALMAGVSLPAAAQGGGGGGRNINPAQIRQALLGQVQAQVGFTDDEWAIVEPKLWRVAALQVDSASGPLGSMLGGARGGRGGGFNLNMIISQVFNNGQPSPAMTRQQELQALVNDPGATPQAFRVKLEEYRTAIKKVKADLVLAQADLQSVLTVRQEAALMQIGFLE
jgi:hypothetical protein